MYWANAAYWPNTLMAAPPTTYGVRGGCHQRTFEGRSGQEGHAEVGQRRARGVPTIGPLHRALTGRGRWHAEAGRIVDRSTPISVAPARRSAYRFRLVEDAP